MENIEKSPLNYSAGKIVKNHVNNSTGKLLKKIHIKYGSGKIILKNPRQPWLWKNILKKSTRQPWICKNIKTKIQKNIFKKSNALDKYVQKFTLISTAEKHF